MSNYVTELFSLDGKVAALTGAGGFLIGEMSRAIARAGAKVAVLDVSLDAANKTVSQITEAGGEAIAIAVDARKREDYQNALDTIVRKWGALDCAVFGAGMNAPTPFREIPVDE